MKKTSYYLIVLILLFVGFQTTAYAAERTSLINTKTNTTELPTEVRKMYNRLDEIKAMDKSLLSKNEKKELRTEVKAIKKHLKTYGHGVYISVSALIIILLLLILLL